MPQHEVTVICLGRTEWEITERELKSLHLTQWASAGRKNNSRAETCESEIDLRCMQRCRGGGGACVTSDALRHRGGSSGIYAIHLSRVYFPSELSYAGKTYSGCLRRRKGKQFVLPLPRWSFIRVCVVDKNGQSWKQYVLWGGSQCGQQITGLWYNVHQSHATAALITGFPCSSMFTYTNWESSIQNY